MSAHTEIFPSVKFLRTFIKSKYPVINLDDYWLAPSEEGPQGNVWKNKPHRVVYDLLGEILRVRFQRDRLKQILDTERGLSTFVPDHWEYINDGTQLWICPGGWISPARNFREDPAKYQYCSIQNGRKVYSKESYDSMLEAIEAYEEAMSPADTEQPHRHSLMLKPRSFPQ